MRENIRMKLYHRLMRRDPERILFWQEFRRRNPGRWGLLKGLTFLLVLQIPGFSGLRGRGEQNPAHLVLRESGQGTCLSQNEWIRRLMPFDVISFDVFDTLLLRPVEDPRDLFWLVGQKLSCPDFRQLRIRAEEEARRKKQREKGSREVTLEDIWKILSVQTGLDIRQGMEAEWETEQAFCYADSTFFPVLAALRRAKKTLVVTSDMYLGKDQIRCLLFQAGLGEFDGYFVSCQEGVSKAQGGLFERVRRCYGASCRYIHVGDHEMADYRMALRKGFEAIRIPSATESGGPFRIRRMSPLVGSMYRGLANQRMHRAGRQYSPLYELGYLYGGLFVVGFCQFLHRRAEEKKIDRLLFLARDGDILQKVFHCLFPDHDSRYVYWSRRAALKLSADERRQEYFQRFLRDKQDRGYTVADCFGAMDLSELLSGLVRKTGVDPHGILTREMADLCERYLFAHFSLVEDAYAQEREAAGRYVAGLLSGCRRAAAVDVGWAGTGPWALKHVARKVCPETKIFTFLAAGASKKSGDDGKLYPEMFSGTVETYLFSPVFNRDLWEYHDPGRGDNLLLELLVASPSSTFTGFSLDRQGQVEFHFGEQEFQAEKIRQVQRGILDFAADWKRHFGQVPGQRISGWDAYAPIRAVLADAGYRKKLEQYFLWKTSMFVE